MAGLTENYMRSQGLFKGRVMKTPTRIGLLFPLESDYAHQFVRGIVRYAHRKGQWDILTEQGVPTLRWKDVLRCEADGFIAGVHTPAQYKMLREQQAPVVNVYHGLVDYPFTTVLTDNRAIGRMAADHLLEQGLTNFAYVGSSTMGYDRERREGFEETVRQAGHAVTPCLTQYIPGSRGAAGRLRVGEKRMAGFLADLKTPVGILAGTDNYGVGVLQAASMLRMAVPEQMAVVAVNNDDVLCDLVRPGLSSIAHDAEHIGYEAAVQLGRLLQGLAAPSQPVFIPPEQLVIRASSDILRIEDTHVAEAIRFIRNHAGQFIDVSDILNVVPISRRSLENRFREALGRTIHHEIRRTHIDRARQLMAQTDASLTEIARRSGFNHTSRFREAFHKETGVSPMTYLKKVRSQK